MQDDIKKIRALMDEGSKKQYLDKHEISENERFSLEVLAGKRKI